MYPFRLEPPRMEQYREYPSPPGRFHRNRFSDVEEETLWVGTLLPVPGSYHNGPNDP